MSTENIQSGSEPMAYKKPVMSVGEEFIAWAEQYWALEEVYGAAQNPQDGETVLYPFVRNTFIRKINEIIANRVENYL